MTYVIPTCEPDDITAGDSLEWDKTLSAFPASEGWELSYSLISKSAPGATADLALAFGTDVTANGDVFEVRVEADDTTDLVAGPYELRARVVNDALGITKSWLVGRALVHSDPATAVGAISHARAMLAALQTAQLAGGSDVYASIQVNGRVTQYATKDDFDRAVAHWHLQVILEENPTAEISHAAVFTRG